MRTISSDSLSTRQRRRDLFARDMTFAEFGGRHARAIDQADFEDRKPWQSPVRLDEVTARLLARLQRRRVGDRPNERGLIVRHGGRG